MPRKREGVVRVELFLPERHPVVKRLMEEAAIRDTTIHQHVRDLLFARELALSGGDYTAFFAWLPPAPTSNAVLPDASSPPEQPAEPSGARAAASVWLRRNTTGGITNGN